MNVQENVSIDLVWEVDEIARVIGRNSRQTFHMLKKGEIPAKKVGGRWVAERGELVRFFRIISASDHGGGQCS